MTDERRRRRGVAAGALLVALLSSGAGLASLPRVVARSSQPAGTDRLLATALARAKAGDCGGVLALLDPFVAVQPVGAQARVTAELLRMPCLAVVGRGKEIPAVLAELKAAVPDNPLVQGYTVFADADAGRDADAADALARLAEARSLALDFLPGSLWETVSQALSAAHDEARRDRVALALSGAEWKPADEPDLPQSLAMDGIGALLARGDLPGATELLASIEEPELLWQMAIQRRYQPLWPVIEGRLGPASGPGIDRFARTALAAYAANGSDPYAIRQAARAFLLLGHDEDVASTTAGVAIQPGMGEDQVTSVLYHAQALEVAGNRTASLDLLRQLARLDLRATPEAAASAISLAEELHDSGLFDEELAVARRTLAPPAASFLSPYGIAWMRRDEVCALSGLKRGDEAKAAGDALKAMAGDNPGAAIEGLLCAGRDGEAAHIAVTALATPEGAERLADQFQPGGAVYAHAGSTLRPLWARLLKRSDVRAAFDRAARILPRTLWPSNEPRPVPVLGTGDASSFA